MQRMRQAWRGLGGLSAAYGQARLRLFLDLLWCRLRYRVDLPEYAQYRFPALSGVERARIVPARLKPVLEARLNDTPDVVILRDKAAFLRRYEAFAGREWLDCRAADTGGIVAFLRAHPDVIRKPLHLRKGEGIGRIRQLSDAVRQRLGADLAGTDVLLEARIAQHPALAALNGDASVNTVRVLAVRDRAGAVHLLGATLRVGVGDSVADNFAGGGVAYPLDMETGIVRTAGLDRHGAHHLRHPGSGAVMPGVAVPHWAALLAMVRAAMDVLPAVRYVGWDVAITQAGPLLVEGNDDAAVRTVQLVLEEGGLLADLRKCL